MTEQQAREHLQTAMIAVQKVRSNAIESHGEETVGLVYPWLAGNKNVLIGIERALAREKIDPLDLYNIMLVLNKLDIVGLWCQLNDVSLPGPDIAWLKGFEG